ncbi:TonB-dependent receptor domain-containing protein [Fidelibacter multiformis]|jgi:outer membrane receptor protein involved in Fe transport|uniref:TonB-dependent receptor n=1 Tax=Fidelibacter multiformis TaxID=3377529 RepID=UPI0037DC506B
MKLKILVLSWILAVASGWLYASTTGKIIGQVTDARTGEPLVGCNIIIEGTYLGAASDMDGNFVILNVPPGEYVIQASMIGYAPQSLQNVSVSVDRTTNLDIEMRVEAVEGEVVTVVADRPMIVRDRTSSASHVSADDIANMPIETVSEVIGTKAGIVDGHFRGGRKGETMYMVDGVPVTDPFTGNQGVVVDAGAVAELQVITGSFNAEYGNAMSGVVNIVTKDGSNTFSGNIHTYFGDYISDETDYFPHIDDINPLSIKNLQLSFEGPLVKDKLFFYTNMRYYTHEGHLWGQRRFDPDNFFYHLDSPDSVVVTDDYQSYMSHMMSINPNYGGDPANDTLTILYETGDNAWIPMNTSEELNFQSKLTWRINPTLRISYNFISNNLPNLFGDYISWTDYSHDWRYTPEGLNNKYSRALTHNINIHRGISSRSYLTFGLSRYSTNYHHYPFGPDEIVNMEIINTATSNSGKPLNTFNVGGMENEYYERRLNMTSLKADYVNQITLHHEIKTGVEFKQTRLSEFRFSLDGQSGNANFDMLVNGEFATLQDYLFASFETIEQANNVLKDFSDYVHENPVKPWQLSAYIQDKIEYNTIVVNAGIRLDYFEPNFHVLSDPRDPNIFTPIAPKNRYKDTNGDGVIQAGEMTADNEYTTEERADFWYRDVEGKYQISPRIGFGYPISDRGSIHVSFGQFLQMPLMDKLYKNPLYQMGTGTGLQGEMGNADLKPERTNQYEIGLQQQISNDIKLQLDIFYRDIRNLQSGDKIIETYQQGTMYSIYSNNDYAEIKGITISLEKRYSNYFSAFLDYTYQVAEGVSVDRNAAYNAINNNMTPEKQLIPLGHDQRHTLNVTTNIGVPGNWNVGIIAKWSTGMPYTIGNLELVQLTQIANTGVKPAKTNVDMRFDKTLNFAGINFNLYFRVSNLFDTMNEYNVFDDTGRATYTTLENKYSETQASQMINGLREYLIQPTNFSHPRRVVAGVQFDL